MIYGKNERIKWDEYESPYFEINLKDEMESGTYPSNSYCCGTNALSMITGLSQKFIEKFNSNPDS